MQPLSLRSRVALVSVAALTAASAEAQFTENFAGFMASLQVPAYTEDFATVPPGQIFGPWAAPGGNGYDFEASAPLGLWGFPGILSTNSNQEAIAITSIGSPITAFGAWIAPTDVEGAVVAGDVTLTINGDSHTVKGVSTFTFVGWTGVSPMQIEAISSVGTWVAIDSVVLGQVVPEPSTHVLLGLMIAGFLVARCRDRARSIETFECLDPRRLGRGTRN